MIRSTVGTVRRAVCLSAAIMSAGFPTGALGQIATDARPQPPFEWRDHPTIHIGDAAEIAVRARFQFDADAGVTEGEDISQGLDFARRRVGVEGVLFKVVEFQVEGELRRDEPWRDVYANYRRSGALQVQAGQFKLPFSLDENASATRLNFVYRSLAATHLAPGRDRGVMLHGRLLRRAVRYEAGVFDRDGRNARTRDPGLVAAGRTVALRVRVAPFAASRGALGDVQGGVAWTSGDVAEGYPGVRGKTVLNATFYPAHVWVNGTRRRMGTELRWRTGPFSIETEYIRVSTERLGESVEDTDLPPLVAAGWYMSGTWVLTGERKSDDLDKPRRPFLRGGVGAIEIAVRTEALAFRTAASGEPPSSSPRAAVVRGNRDRADTMGVTWYLNRWIKVQGNLVRERLADPELGPLPSVGPFWSRLLRLQFTL